jgi:hypothetical protein
MTPLLERVAAKMPVICTTPTRPSRSASRTSAPTTPRRARAAAPPALKALGDTKKGKVALFVGRIDMQNAIERRAASRRC